MFITLIFTLILTFIDQIIKIFIDHKFLLDESKEIIPNFFNITNAHNYGAAWSILNDKSLFLIIVAIIALILIYFYFIKGKDLKKTDIVLVSMLSAGVIGNMVDRIRLGYVIDYLDFKIFGYDYPIFNLADIFIVISIFLLILKAFKEDKNGKNNSSDK